MTLQEGALKWYPVSTTVNNVHHKTADCRKETKPKWVENEVILVFYYFTILVF